MGEQQKYGTLRKVYLMVYNALCASLWLRVLVTVLRTPVQEAYTELECWTRWTQTVAILEILHAAAGKSHISIILPS